MNIQTIIWVISLYKKLAAKNDELRPSHLTVMVLYFEEKDSEVLLVCIPSRGEIGLTSNQIALYEDVDYVGRHLRIRIENLVIDAEEKRGILKLERGVYSV